MKKETLDDALRGFREIPNHGCIPDSYTYGTLINGLCKLGKISEAKELFREMNAKVYSPIVATCTSLLHRPCLSNILDEAMELCKEMSRKGIKPNVVTFSSLMDGLCNGRRSLQALKLLEKMAGKRFSDNIIIYNNIVSGLCKEGKVQDAVQILDRMKLQGLKPYGVLYGRLVNSLCNSSKFQEVTNLLNEMVPGGMLPIHVSWRLHVNNHNMVVSRLCTEKDLNRAFKINLSTRTKHISVDSETYKSLVGCFSKKGYVYKASQIVNEMLLEGSIPDECIWIAVVCGFLLHTKVKEAAEVTMKGVLFHAEEAGVFNMKEQVFAKMANQDKSHHAMPGAAEGVTDMRKNVQAETERRMQEPVLPRSHINPPLPAGAVIDLQPQEEQNREKSRVSIYDRMGEATGEHNSVRGPTMR
ncbi:hypothetical protein GIB67_001419 [Kingdonia uniflora]|uniref:Pentatricopeptide repeat-containing protein n=1 Tax=Kingdonia uniflora TaxID=39325 RepID=A0A7J7LYW8_9MAGN|nr:hypothetical protein GIB67_001419 [Kingdonia uniflora]